MEAELVVPHADAVLAYCSACRIYLVDSEALIEFQDGEDFTAGRAPR
ncbi:hypothetical protein ACWGPD_08415 [Streptomyces hirsutus]